MARILAISSQVSSGHVGLSAIVPALHLLGHDAIALTTVILSNHPGHPHVAGLRIDPVNLAAMLDALQANARLDDIDTVLTGYLPTEAHVRFAETAIDAVATRNPQATIICDPVLGDDPKGLYIDEGAARAIRDILLPRADVALPNRFELQWLTGLAVDDLDTATSAARHLPSAEIVATSIPAGSTAKATRLVTARIAGATVEACETNLRTGVPHGTGDLLAGLYAAGLPLPEALALLDHVIVASLGRPELALIEAARTWPNRWPSDETSSSTGRPAP